MGYYYSCSKNCQVFAIFRILTTMPLTITKAKFKSKPNTRHKTGEVKDIPLKTKLDFKACIYLSGLIEHISDLIQLFGPLQLSATLQYEANMLFFPLPGWLFPMPLRIVMAN